MKRRKAFAFAFLFIWLLSSYCLPAFAADELKEQTDAEAVFSEIYDAVDADTKSAIADLGLDEISYESLLSLSPRAVITELLEILTGKLQAPLRAAGLMLAFVDCDVNFAFCIRNTCCRILGNSALHGFYVGVYSRICGNYRDERKALDIRSIQLRDGRAVQSLFCGTDARLVPDCASIFYAEYFKRH